MVLRRENSSMRMGHISGHSQPGRSSTKKLGLNVPFLFLLLICHVGITKDLDSEDAVFPSTRSPKEVEMCGEFDWGREAGGTQDMADFPSMNKGIEI